MALIMKILGANTITGTEMALTPSAQASKCLLVKNVLLTNTGTGLASLEIYVKRGSSGAAFQIAPKPITIPAGTQFVLDSEITLNLNTTNVEVIYGKFSTGTGAVDSVVNGFERDI